MTISYPTGYNNENCILLSFGIGRTANEYNYGQAIQDSGATFNANPVHYASLKTGGIILHAAYGVDGLTTENTLLYKIVLMKL